MDKGELRDVRQLYLLQFTRCAIAEDTDQRVIELIFFGQHPRHSAYGIIKLSGDKRTVQPLPYHPVTEVILQLDMAGCGGGFD